MVAAYMELARATPSGDLAVHPPLPAELPTPTELPTPPMPKDKYLPDAEEHLQCHAKRHLFSCFEQAGVRELAEWLFSNPKQAFHHDAPLTHSSFADAIGIRASKVVPSLESAMLRPRGAVVPGHDLLLVPVRKAGSRIIGYAFGGIECIEDETYSSCVMAEKGIFFLPHAVSRFTYDVHRRDLLIVMHGLQQGMCALMHVRGVADDAALIQRHFTWMALEGGCYGFHKLPGRIFAMVTAPERAVDGFLAKYQFATPALTEDGRDGGTSVHAMSLQQGMAALERFLKGRFASDKFCKDDMDPDVGLMSRSTIKAEEELDGKDAVTLRIFKDMAIRMYYSYMSKVAQNGHGQAAQT